MNAGHARLQALQAELSTLRTIIARGNFTRTQYQRFVELARILNQAVL